MSAPGSTVQSLSKALTVFAILRLASDALPGSGSFRLFAAQLQNHGRLDHRQQLAYISHLFPHPDPDTNIASIVACASGGDLMHVAIRDGHNDGRCGICCARSQIGIGGKQNITEGLDLSTPHPRRSPVVDSCRNTPHSTYLHTMHNEIISCEAETSTSAFSLTGWHPSP
jgi:hypothetical protein